MSVRGKARKGLRPYWTQHFNRDSAVLDRQAAIPSPSTSPVLNLSNVQAISQL